MDDVEKNKQEMLRDLGKREKRENRAHEKARERIARASAATAAPPPPSPPPPLPPETTRFVAPCDLVMFDNNTLGKAAKTTASLDPTSTADVSMEGELLHAPREEPMHASTAAATAASSTASTAVTAVTAAASTSPASTASTASTAAATSPSMAGVPSTSSSSSEERLGQSSGSSGPRPLQTVVSPTALVKKAIKPFSVEEGTLTVSAPTPKRDTDATYPSLKLEPESPSPAPRLAAVIDAAATVVKASRKRKSTNAFGSGTFASGINPSSSATSNDRRSQKTEPVAATATATSLPSKTSPSSSSIVEDGDTSLVATAAATTEVPSAASISATPLLTSSSLTSLTSSTMSLEKNGVSTSIVEDGDTSLAATAAATTSDDDSPSLFSSFVKHSSAEEVTSSLVSSTSFCSSSSLKICTSPLSSLLLAFLTLVLLFYSFLSHVIGFGVETADESAFPLRCQTLSGKTVTIVAKPGDSIENIKHKVEEKVGIPVNKQHLIFGGKQLDNAQTLCYYGIGAASNNLHLLSGIRGGMVPSRPICSRHLNEACAQNKDNADRFLVEHSQGNYEWLPSADIMKLNSIPRVLCQRCGEEFGSYKRALDAIKKNSKKRRLNQADLSTNLSESDIKRLSESMNKSPRIDLDSRPSTIKRRDAPKIAFDPSTPNFKCPISYPHLYLQSEALTAFRAQYFAGKIAETLMADPIPLYNFDPKTSVMCPVHYPHLYNPSPALDAYVAEYEATKREETSTYSSDEAMQSKRRCFVSRSNKAGWLIVDWGMYMLNYYDRREELACLYLAVSGVMANGANDLGPYEAAELRRRVIIQLRTNPTLQVMMERGALDVFAQDLGVGRFNSSTDYIDHIERGSVLSGDPEIYAAAIICGRPIHVHMRHGGNVVIYLEWLPGVPIQLEYDGIHFVQFTKVAEINGVMAKLRMLGVEVIDRRLPPSSSSGAISQKRSNASSSSSSRPPSSSSTSRVTGMPVDENAEWFKAAPPYNGGFSPTQLEVLSKETSFSAVQYRNSDGTVSSESGICPPVHDKHTNECCAFAEDEALGHRSIEELVKKTPNGGTLVITSSSTFWRPFARTFAKLAVALEADNKRLLFISARVSDGEQYTESALDRSSIKGVKNVDMVRVFPTTQGGTKSLCVVRNGEFFINKVSAAQDPMSFGNSTTASRTQAELDNGLEKGLLERFHKDALVGMGANGLRVQTDVYAKEIKAVVQQYPFLLETMKGPMTLALFTKLKNTLPPRVSVSGVAQVGAPFVSYNYVLGVSDVDVTVIKVKEKIDQYIEENKGRRLPLGLVDILARLDGVIKDGKGDLQFGYVNSGYTGVSPSHAKKNGDLPNHLRCDEHFRREGGNGNPLPMLLAKIVNSIKAGTATAISGAHIAATGPSSEGGLIREIIFAVFLRSQPGPANEIDGFTTRGDMVCVGTNFQQPGPTPGSPFMSAMYLSCGEFGDRPLGTLMRDEYHRSGAAFLVDRMEACCSMTLVDAVALSAKEAWSKFCSINGKKGGKASLLTETSASAISLMASSCADASVRGDYHEVMSKQADFDGSHMGDSAASVASLLGSLSNPDVAGDFYENAELYDALYQTFHSKSAASLWSKFRAEVEKGVHADVAAAATAYVAKHGGKMDRSAAALQVLFSQQVAAKIFDDVYAAATAYVAKHGGKMDRSAAALQVLFSQQVADKLFDDIYAAASAYDLLHGTHFSKSGAAVQDKAAAAVKRGDYKDHYEALEAQDEEDDTEHTKSGPGITAGKSKAFLEELGSTYRLVISNSTPPEVFSVAEGAKEVVKRSQANGVQILGISDQLALLHNRILAKGGEQSFTSGPSVVRLIKHEDQLPALTALPRLLTAFPLNWDSVPVAEPMPLGYNDAEKLDGVKCGNGSKSSLTELATREFNTFHECLAPRYRTENSLSAGYSVFLVYCEAYPSPMIFHCEKRFRTVMKSWDVYPPTVSRYVNRTQARARVTLLNKGEVVIFHSEVV